MSEAPEKYEVAYGHYAPKDEQGREHGVCFDYKTVNGTLSKILHAVVKSHGKVLEVLPKRGSVTIEPDLDGTTKRNITNRGVTFRDLREALKDFQAMATRPALTEASVEEQKALPEAATAPAVVTVPSAGAAA